MESNHREFRVLSVPKPPSHLIIQGNFAQPGISRLLRMSARIFSVLLILLGIGTLAMYGVKVHFEDSVNRLAKDTRELSEKNKELQVRLNRIRSFKNVEAAAGKVPHLHLPETVIDIPVSGKTQLPSMPKPKQEFPRIYGY